MRRAEWRRRADEPTSPFGWWWRGIVERPFFRQPRVLAFATLPFVVCGAVGLAGGGWGWMLLASANLLFALSRPRQKDDRLAALLADPPPPGQFRATVEYRREGLRTGTDEMALTPVDGWLVGEGLRSHFALRTVDLDDLVTGSDRTGRLSVVDGGEVRLLGLDDGARVVLERWYAARVLPPGEPTFPPMRVHPEEILRWGSRYKLWMLLVAVGGLSTTLFLNSEWSPWLLFLLAGLLSFPLISLHASTDHALKFHAWAENEASLAETSVLSDPLATAGRRLEDDRAEARSSVGESPTA